MQLWNTLNKPIFGTKIKQIQMQWREPFLCVVQLHQDYFSRFFLALALAATIGCVFFIAGYAETKDPISGLIAGCFGFFFLGLLVGAGWVLDPEAALGSTVQLQEDKLFRHRSTISYTGMVRRKDYLPYCQAHVQIVFAADMHKGFSVLNWLYENNSHTAIVYVPLHIDLMQLIQCLEQSGARVERITPESLVLKPTYHWFWKGFVLTLLACSIVGVVAALVFA